MLTVCGIGPSLFLEGGEGREEEEKRVEEADCPGLT